VSIGQFLNPQGQPADYFYPAVGDTNVEGVIESVVQGITGAGTVRADARQGVAGSGWAGAPASGPLDTNPISYGNPLRLQYSGQGTFCRGQRVKFDVAAAPFGAEAVNVQAI
jgi:hypothetical protein